MTDDETSTVACWRPDPEEPGVLRWWDGQGWTENRTPAPAEDTKNGSPKRRRLWWALGAGGVVVVGLAAALVLPNLVRTFTGSTRGANAYLDAVRDGRTGDAYRLLCSDVRETLDVEAFGALLKEDRAVAGELVSFNAYKSEVTTGNKGASVWIRVETSTGSGELRARMAQEDGKWLWCGTETPPEDTTFRVPLP